MYVRLIPEELLVEGEPKQDNGFIVPLVQGRVRTGYHVPMVIIGTTGKGKTCMGLLLAEEVDPTFVEDMRNRYSAGSVSGFLNNIKKLMGLTPEEWHAIDTFDVKTILELMTSERVQEIKKDCMGKAVLFDEAGVGASDSRFMSNMNLGMRWVAQTYRVFKFIPIMIIPQFYRLDPGVRSQIFLVIDVQDRGYAIVFRQIVDSFKKKQSGIPIGTIGSPDSPVRLPSQKILESLEPYEIVEKLKIISTAEKMAHDSEARQRGNVMDGKWKGEREGMTVQELHDFIQKNIKQVTGPNGTVTQELVEYHLEKQDLYCKRSILRGVLKERRDGFRGGQQDYSGDLRDYLIERCEDEYGDIEARILRLTMEGTKQVDIAETVFGQAGSQPQVSLTLAPIREKSLGYWYEDFARREMELPRRRDEDKNKPLPDVVTDDGKIVSLKCYLDKKNSVTIQPLKDCMPEIDAAREANSTFTVQFYNPIWDEVWRFEIDPNKIPLTVTFRRRNQPKVKW